MRRGEALPPISVYRVGDVHFVRDGHHRVSVARALGRDDIDATVTEVVTRVGAERSLLLSDLPLKSHERLFRERVPLPREARARVRLTDPWRYGDLAEGVEAWALPRDAGPRGLHGPRDRGERLVRPRVPARRGDGATRPASAARGPRTPTRTSRWAATATG